MGKTAGVIELLFLTACGVAFSADKASIIYVEGNVTLDGAPASVGDAVAAGATLRAFSQNLTSPHHQEVRVTRAQSGLSVGAAPMLYHSDGDVEAIAARIGERIDWTKVDRQP